MSVKLVGLVSDTHGLVRPDISVALADAELLLHAGDIGSPHVLDTLRSIAPVRAVQGNTDTDPWGRALPRSLVAELGGQVFYVVHDLALLDLDPVTAGVSVVVHGHTHRPHTESRDGVWYVNPGSAGPRRSALPPTVAKLWIDRGHVDVQIVELAG